MTSNDYIVMEIDGVRTLPLYSLVARTKEEIPAFGSGKAEFVYAEPELDPSPYRCDYDSLALASRDWEFAVSATNAWRKYANGFIYFLQFRDDSTKILARSFNDHVELLSIICDVRLGLDPTPFSRTFRSIMTFGIVHGEYRLDPNRADNYEKYATKLELVYKDLCEHSANAGNLVARMQRLFALNRSEWPSLKSLVEVSNESKSTTGLKLFCSYSHKDELLRDQLEAHLALLRRERAIYTWHDRKITAGQEWKGEIDQNLAAADIVLLLISADFINSDYCFDVEMQSAIKRHENGECRVVPVVLRDCDWTNAVFGKLQALPKDAKPVTSWQNVDEAFTNIAKGLRLVTNEIKVQREAKDL